MGSGASWSHPRRKERITSARSRLRYVLCPLLSNTPFPVQADHTGPGLVTSHLAPNFASLHAIDVSPSMLLYFSRTHSSSIITHSLHFLNPSSSTEFTQPLLSPLHNEPERRLTPPRNKFGVAVMNLVLHHVEDWSGLMQGIQGLLEDGGWFVGTEFGKTEDGRDVVKEAREQKGDAEMQVIVWFYTSLEGPVFRRLSIGCLIMLI